MPWLAAAATLAVATVGCGNKKPEMRVDTDEPAYPTLSEVSEDTVAVQAVDLGVDDSTLDEVGVKVLDTEPTVGRFPTGLTVVRVEAFSREEAQERRLRLVSIPDYRGVYWGRVTQDLPGLREVRLQCTYGLDPRGTDWRGLLKSSLQSNCALCLVYTYVDNTKADAEVAGVLWDAVLEKAVAAFRVPIVLSPEVRMKYEKKEQFVRLRSDAEFRAESELRRLVRDTIWDLTTRDGEMAARQPNPWQTNQLVIPRDLHRNIRIFLDKKSEE